MSIDNPQDDVRTKEEHWHQFLIESMESIQRFSSAAGNALSKLNGFLRSEGGMRLTEAFTAIAESERQAKHLSEMIHSKEEGLTSIQEELTRQPINALALMWLIDIERAQDASALEKMVSEQRSNAVAAANARHANDPKQAAKCYVYQRWQEWQVDPARYPKGKSQFARDMLDKQDALASQNVITGWCRDWEKGKKIPVCSAD